MKTAIWGWYPPYYLKYESGKYMIIYNPVEFKETITHIDHEAEKEIVETITRWNVWYEEMELPLVTEYLNSNDLILANRLILSEIIKLYDASEEVNICYIKTSLGTIPYWANKAERSSLKSAVQDCIAMGRDTYRLDLRDVGISVEIACDKLLQMLSALEVYAIDCYNKTTDHIFTVSNLDTLEKLESYNYRDGYPEKLTFDI